VAVANEYISYLATFEEYSAQHFEGAFTLYGPNETEFFQQEVSKLALRLDREIQIPYSRSFFPGKGKEIFRIGQVIQPRKWKSLTTEVKRDALGNLKEVRFKWLGFRKNRFCTKLPAVKVIRLKTGQALTGPGGMAETDDWLNFKVRRWGRRTWSAVWTPPDGLIFDGPLQIVVERSLDLQPLTSEPFYLTKKGL
jgi:hypothetical protein